MTVTIFISITGPSIGISQRDSNLAQPTDLEHQWKKSKIVSVKKQIWNENCEIVCEKTEIISSRKSLKGLDMVVAL